MISDVLIGRHPDRSAMLARLGWLGLTAYLLMIFALNEWQLFIDLTLPCATPCSDPIYLSAGEIAEMQARGYALSVYAAAQVGLYVVFFLINATLATLIFWRRADERMARYAALALLLWGRPFRPFRRDSGRACRRWGCCS